MIPENNECNKEINAKEMYKSSTLLTSTSRILPIFYLTKNILSPLVLKSSLQYSPNVPFSSIKMLFTTTQRKTNDL